jgi:DNA-binding transcriptional regulator YiaG
MMQLRLAGLSYAKIAKRAGISPQRVQQILSPPPAVMRFVRDRAQQICESCGLDIHDAGHVHHKGCKGLQADTYQDIENLQYLCVSCHTIAHSITRNLETLNLEIPIDPPMTPEELRSIREQTGLGPVAFARCLGVAYSTLWRWENDEAKITPAMERLIRMTAAQYRKQRRNIR